jgi:hypothetical protein
MRLRAVWMVGAILVGVGCGSVERDADDDPMADASADDGGDDPDAALPPSCSDGETNQDETDLDCGGPCAPCQPHRRCEGGADCSTGSCIDTTCALVSGPPSWIPGSTLPTYTGNMGAGLADGTVWVLDGSRVAFWDEFSWVEIAADDTRSIDLPTRDLAVAGDGTNLWAVGGADSDGERVTRAWGLLPGALAWTALDGIDPARSNLAAAIGPDGNLYAIGGGVGVETDMSAYNAVIESFTPPPAAPGTTSWDPSPPDLPFGMFFHGAASTGGYLYVVGGTAFSGELATVIRWRPGDREWVSRADMTTVRTRVGAAGAPDGRLYAVGGTNGVDTLATVEAYAPEADRWFPVAPLLTARSRQAVTVGPDGRIWAIGGQSDVPLGTVEIYGPELGLNPVDGPPGTQVQIAGTNFAAGATVSIRLGAPDGELIGTAATSGTGAMTTPVVYDVPDDAAPGETIQIYAVDDKSVFPVHLPFTVE